ncbi:hypothetical protein H0H81_006758 [Sphagnurus paluster]|uniref:F-box domain-containing protein n=1 Tax=Sphagnurus paluster TaxID=117069 RepID=A0A9P7FV21_9AGAR|nr:hypothetical protein H0H81_006758 [Sphagnurus paluster]
MILDTETTIASIELQIEALQEKIRRDKKCLYRLRAAIAPHKKLPVEVLSKIFQSLNAIEVTHVPPRAHGFPWNIRRTCRTWSDIIKGDLNLRSRKISVDIRRNYPANNYGFKASNDLLFHAINSVLPSSSPIQFSYQTPSLKKFITDQRILSTVLPYATEISFHSTTLAVYEFLTFTPNQPLPLQRLSFLLPCDLGPILPLRSGSSIFPYTPSLREINLSGQCAPSHAVPSIESLDSATVERMLALADWTDQRVWEITDRMFPFYPLSCFSEAIPWSQLTHINILGVVGLYIADGDFGILVQCTRLTHCAFTVLDEQSSIVYEFPRLESLTILSEETVLNALSMPALTTLHIECWEFPRLQLRLLTERQGCRLKIFAHDTSRDVDSTPWDPIMPFFFSYLPDLVELRTPKLHIPLEVFEMIARGEQLPLLEVLECRGAIPEDLDALTDTLECRWQASLSGRGKRIREACMFIYRWCVPVEDRTWSMAFRRFEDAIKGQYGLYTIREWTPNHRSCVAR